MALSKIVRDSLSTGIDDNSDATAITIDSSERVGINTNSPEAMLQVQNGDITVGWADNFIGTQFQSGSDYRLGMKFGTVNRTTKIIAEAADNNGEITFEVNGSERARIDSSGNVGIGTTSMSNTLQVNGNGVRLVNSADTDALHLQYFSSNNAVYAMYSNTGTAAVQITASDTPHAGFGSASRIIGVETVTIVGTNNLYGSTICNKSLYATGGTSVNGMYFLASNNDTAGYISWNGSSTAYNTSSDYRMKQGVEDMTGAIARVNQLAPKRFQFIDATDVTVDGFLAHEAQAVVPEAVRGTKDEVDDDGNAVYQAIDQSKLVPLLTAALKESIAKIEALETEMTALKARVTALEAG